MSPYFNFISRDFNLKSSYFNLNSFYFNLRVKRCSANYIEVFIAAQSVLQELAGVRICCTVRHFNKGPTVAIVSLRNFLYELRHPITHKLLTDCFLRSSIILFTLETYFL